MLLCQRKYCKPVPKFFPEAFQALLTPKTKRNVQAYTWFALKPRVIKLSVSFILSQSQAVRRLFHFLENKFKALIFGRAKTIVKILGTVARRARIASAPK